MKYYKAFSHASKPFIIFNLWAESLEELQKMGADNDPLILPQESLPTLINGVYPMKIVGNALVARNQAEMDAFEVVYLQEKQLRDYQNSPLDTETFTFDTHEFPVHPVARCFYSIIERDAQNYKVLSTSGIYTLEDTDIPAFLEAYYDKLKTLTQPIIP